MVATAKPKKKESIRSLKERLRALEEAGRSHEVSFNRVAQDLLDCRRAKEELLRTYEAAKNRLEGLERDKAAINGLLATSTQQLDDTFKLLSDSQSYSKELEETLVRLRDELSALKALQGNLVDQSSRQGIELEELRDSNDDMARVLQQQHGIIARLKQASLSLVKVIAE